MDSAQKCEPTKTPRPLFLASGGMLVLATVATVLWIAIDLGSRTSAPVATVEVARTNLVLVSGRLYRAGETNSFTGLMTEWSGDGALRSRSAVSNGLLNGLSEGYYTNGQVQVQEHFHNGVSHGLRTKYYASGAKLSEAMIVNGQLEGPFQRWFENGVLAERIELSNGVPSGLSLAYHPSGSLKARVQLQAGKIVEKQSWSDGEFQQ